MSGIRADAIPTLPAFMPQGDVVALMGGDRAPCMAEVLRVEVEEGISGKIRDARGGWSVMRLSIFSELFCCWHRTAAFRIYRIYWHVFLGQHITLHAILLRVLGRRPALRRQLHAMACPNEMTASTITPCLP